MKLGAKDYISKGNLNVIRLTEAINEIILDSCSILEISPEIISKIQDIFNNDEEITPHQTLSIKYRENEQFEKELINALDILNKNNYVEKTSLFTTITCPSCDSNPEELYLACPICNSYELIKGEVIEHNKCHHIDFKTNFIDAEGRLTCPKCGDLLKQIGVDYIKVGINYKCNNSHIFPNPEHRYVCNKCGKEFNEDESKIITIYKYKLLNEGKISLKICDSVKNAEYIENYNEHNIVLEKNLNAIL